MREWNQHAVRVQHRVFMILSCHDPVAFLICASLRQDLQSAFELWMSVGAPNGQLASGWLRRTNIRSNRSFIRPVFLLGCPGEGGPEYRRSRHDRPPEDGGGDGIASPRFP